MAPWSQVILEWVNCLGLSDQTVKNPKELDDNQVYSKIITSISSWKSRGNNRTEKDLLLNFIQDEYPDFISTIDDSELLLDNVLVASLLLLRTSQEPTFHRPMCTKLDHDTQVKIKMFLETVLPYGKSITRDYLSSAISELGDAELVELSYPKTPHLTPKGRPLKDFFNSPAARSAQSHSVMIERNRELRKLKTELEMERCEKSDLIEDLRIQQEKMQKLQKKLQEKEKDLKFLRAEMMKPATPQSCKKTDKTIADVYREEIKSLEEFAFNLQEENEKLKDDKDILTKKLTTIERQNATFIEANDYFQKNFESLSAKMEQKGREIVNLQMENEGLRVHLKEMNRLSLSEESFECDNVSNANTPSSLNSSEALSSVIDIQLQEAKEETSRLKSELESITQLLNSADLECRQLKDTNNNLYQKLKLIEGEFQDVKSELLASKTRTEKLNEEKTILFREVQSMKKQIEEDKITMKNLNDKLLDSKDSLKHEITSKVELESMISQFRVEVQEKNDFISELERLNTDYQVVIKDCKTLLKDPMIRNLQLSNEQDFDVDQANILDLGKHLKIMIHYFESLNENNISIIANLSQETQEKNRAISKLALELATLEDQNEKNVVEKSEIMKTLNLANDEIYKLQNTIDENSREIQKLREIANHRDTLLENISKLQFDLSEKSEFMDSLETNVRQLRETKNSLERESEVMRQELSKMREELADKHKIVGSLEESLVNLTSLKSSLEKDVKLGKTESHNLQKELTQRNEFIDVLENNIEEFKGKKLLLEMELNSIKEKISLTQEELTEKNKSVGNLEENLEELKGDKSSLEKELSSLKKEFSTLQEDLREKNQTTETLQINIANLEENKSSLELKLESLTEKSINTQRELTNKLEMIKVLENSNTELKNKKSSLESKLNELNSVKQELFITQERLADKHKNAETLEESLVNLTRLKSSLEKDLELGKTESHNLQKELTQRNEFINVLENNIEEFKKNKLLLERELNLLKQKNSLIQEELSEKNKSVENLEENLEELKGDKSSLEKELASLKKGFSTLQEDLREKNQTIQTLQTNVTNLEENKSSLALKLESVTEKYIDIQQELTNKIEMIKVLENRNTELKNKKSSLESELNEFNSVRQELCITQEELSVKNKTVEILEEKVEKLNKIHSSLENELKLTKQELSKVEELLSHTNPKTEDLQASIEKLEKSKLSLETQIDSLEYQLVETEKKFFDKNEEAESLESDIAEFRKCKYSLEQKLDFTQKEISKFQTELVEKNKEINYLKEDFVHLKENKLSLEEDSNLTKEEMFKVQESLNEKIHIIENLETDIQALKKENSSIKTEINSVKSEFYEIQTDLSNKIGELEACEIAMEELKMKKLSLDEEVDSVKIVLTEVQQELNEKIQDLIVFEAKVKDLEENKISLEDKVESVTREFSQLAHQHKLSDDMIQKMSTDYSDLQNRFKDLESENQKANNKIIQNEMDLTNTRATICNLEEALLQRLEEQSILEKGISIVLRDLESLKENFETIKVREEEKEIEIHKLNGEIESLKEQKTKLESNVDSLTDESASLKHEISEMSNDLESRSKENGNLILEVQKLSQENEVFIIKKEKEDTRMKILVDSLENRLLNNQNSFQELNMEIKLKEDTIQILEAKLESLSKEKIEAELKLNETVLHLQEFQVKLNSDLETQMKVLQGKEKEVVDLKKKCEDFVNMSILKDQLQEKCSVLEKFRKEKEQVIAELQRFLQTQKQEICIVQEHCKSMEIERSNIVEGCRDLQTSLSDLKNILLQEDVLYQNTHTSENESDILKADDFSANLKDGYVYKVLQASVHKVNLTSKAFVALSEKCNNLEKSLLDEKKYKEKIAEFEKRNLALEDEKRILETREEEQKVYVENLIQKKESLYETLATAARIRDDFNLKLIELEQNWNKTLNEFQDTLSINQSACDTLKDLQNKKTVLQNLISYYRRFSLQNVSSLPGFSVKTYLWTEKKIRNAEEDEDLELENEKYIFLSEIQKIESLIKEIESTKKEIESFSDSANIYKKTAEVNRAKYSFEKMNKLELQVKNLTKEKKDLKEKFDNVRARNAKLEKNMDELRSELKKLNSSQPKNQPESQLVNLESEMDNLKEKLKCSQGENINLKAETDYLREENRCLKAEIGFLKMAKTEKTEEVKQMTSSEIEGRMKQIHDEYETKLEKLKQKMKLAYNEQMQKLTVKQEKAIQERVEALQAKMEQQCRKHTEEMNKYKQHVSELTSRHWEVCDKLLAEKQEKEGAFKQMKEMSLQFNNDLQEIHQRQISTASLHKTASSDRRDFSMTDDRRCLQAFQIIEEETFARRRSVRGLQAMGNAFDAEDEEGEVFNNVYLADMKEGQARSIKPDVVRLSVLQMRNSLCKPHLKSSYPAETQFHPLGLTEEDIKSGVTTEDVFNDSLSQSLLPGQKVKKRDRTQTSYKKPGPPTPSKNGGRLSLQGNELRSPTSRILKERNTVDRRTSATPRRLKDFFSNSRQQDENASGTPRRFSNIFRKKRLPTERK